MSKYCCLFSHYNPNKTINAYVFSILDYFSSIDCSIVIISNSPVEDERGKTLLKERFKGKFIERENKGYDFGAWQYAMDLNLIPDDTQHLFLMNDSVFGPFANLERVVQNILSRDDVDFWGLTDCYQLEWHLQSYFLCFNRRTFSSDVFKKVFQQEFSRFEKSEIIHKGEILLSSALINAGFKGKAFVGYDSLMKSTNTFNRDKNPTHYFAYELIKDFQFPFIKKEFVFVNPENIEIKDGVWKMLKEETSYPMEYIKEAFLDACSVDETVRKKKPLIDVICHLYYLNTAYNFLLELKELKKYNCRFLFNLSGNLCKDPFFVSILTESFKNCVIIQASNIGKDIGGKLALIDLSLRLKERSDFSIMLHDKQSPHTSVGSSWRKKLFRIIEPHMISKIIESFFSNDKVGIVASGEFVMNEYNTATKEFDGTNNRILKRLLKEYKLTNDNFDFVGGTMFWIRTQILYSFFLKNKPLEIRSTLEKGNVLDNDQGTETHAWERMLSWIAIDQQYKIMGINE